MRTLFLRFEVESYDGYLSPEEIVEDLAERCWKWVRESDNADEDKLPVNWEIGSFPLDENESGRVIVNDQLCNDGRFWRLTRDEWGNEEKAMRYVNYIFIARDGDRVEFSLLQDVVRQFDRVGPPIEDVHPPKIIGEIIGEYSCIFQGELLSGEWDFITQAETVEFVKKGILRPSRVLPIVLISKKLETDEGIIEQIGHLSRLLSGIAHVYILGDKKIGRSDSLFGRQKLYDGSIRVFWPGLTAQKLKYPAWEDMYSSKKFEELYSSEENVLIQEIVNKICSATAGVPASSRLVKRVRRRIAEELDKSEREEEERERLGVLKKLKTSSEIITHLETEIEDLSNKFGITKIKLASREEDIRDMSASIDSLKFQLQKHNDELSGYKQLERDIKRIRKENPEKTLQEFMAYLGEFGKENDEDIDLETEPEFDSLAAAVADARMNFQNLIFLESAIKSSEESNSDVDPGKVHDVFKWLNNKLWKKMKDQIQSEKNKNKKRDRNYVNKEMYSYLGSKYAETESTLTMDKYGSEKNSNGRLFRIDEKTLIRMKPHIRFRSPRTQLRIHLVCLDRNTNVEVVEFFKRKNGNIGHNKPMKVKASKILNSFPAIIIGWCGDHLPTARNKG